MKRIMIDPGHGGLSEPGAVNATVKEKDINLIVATKLKDLLITSGFIVEMTRYVDTKVSLTDRCNTANTWKANLFISIHHNASGSGSDGYEVIHSINGGESKDFAYKVGKQFEILGQNKRNIYYRENTARTGKDYYSVIGGTNMPAVITEFGFMDSKDYEAFDTLEELYGEAYAIYLAVCNHYMVELPKKEELIMEEVIDIQKALDILVDAKIINSKAYWDRTLDIVNYQKDLFINMANYIKKQL